jgi:hypothetical protein
MALLLIIKAILIKARRSKKSVLDLHLSWLHTGNLATTVMPLCLHIAAVLDNMTSLQLTFKTKSLLLSDKWLLKMVNMLLINACNKTKLKETVIRMLSADLQLEAIPLVELPKECPSNFLPVVFSNLAVEVLVPTIYLDSNNKPFSSSSMNNINSNPDKLIITTCNGQSAVCPQVALET